MIAGNGDHTVHGHDRRPSRGAGRAVGGDLGVQRDGARERGGENEERSSHASVTRQARRRFITGAVTDDVAQQM